MLTIPKNQGQGKEVPEPRLLQRPRRRKIPLITKPLCQPQNQGKSQTRGQKSHYNVSVVVASLTFGLTFVLGFEAGTKAFLSMEFSSSSGVVAVAALALPSPHLIF